MTANLNCQIVPNKTALYGKEIKVDTFLSDQLKKFDIFVQSVPVPTIYIKLKWKWKKKIHDAFYCGVKV
jgi:hypothetical protein